MSIFALYSMKGGVGKTAAAVNLAYEAVQSGATALLCDLDPQGAAAFYFRIRAKKKFGRKRFLKGGKHLENNIRGTDFEGLDLLPSAMSFRNLDLGLDARAKNKNYLKRLLTPIRQEYDYIFFDCPPNLTLLAEHVFRAADYVIVPCIPTTLSMLTHQKLVDFFKKNKLKRKKMVSFFSMVEQRKTMHREMIAQVGERKGKFLNAQIPYTTDVERMGWARQPVACFRPRSKATQAYRELWVELQMLK